MFTFTIHPDAAPEYELKATSRDLYVWERTGRDRSLAKLLESASIASCYELAHITAVRLGKFTGSLDAFAATNDLEFREEEEPDPTQPDHSPES